LATREERLFSNQARSGNQQCERVAMQWRSDGKPTWHAPKWVALWGMVPFMLAVRLFIWLASTYAPQSGNGAELGIVLFSVIVTAAHIFVLKIAQEAN
jgi:hypothetical protein